MKHLFIGAAAILILTGCHSDNYRGRPAQDSYIEGSNDRSFQSKSTDNLREVGRGSSPTSPLTAPNGSLNF